MIFDISHADIRKTFWSPKESPLVSRPVVEIAERMQNLQLPKTSGII